MSKNLKIVITSILVIVLGVAGVVFAETIVNNFYGEATVNMPDGGEATLGAVTAVGGVCNGSEPTTQMCRVNVYELESQTALTAADGTFSDDLTVTDDAAVSGDLTLGDHFNQAMGIITGTTTLTASSENIQQIAASAASEVITLPAVTATGTFFRIFVSGAQTGGYLYIDSAEGDNIDGTLIVAGAVVDCRGEDQINFVTDGEAIGDYVELYSNGQQWVIVDSGALASGKMTCTDPS